MDVLHIDAKEYELKAVARMTLEERIKKELAYWPELLETNPTLQLLQEALDQLEFPKGQRDKWVTGPWMRQRDANGRFIRNSN